MVRSVKVQRAHQVHIVRAELRVFEKGGERPLYQLNTFFRRVYLRRLLRVQRNEAVPDVALVLFEPSLHLVHLLLRYHSFIVEHARVLLQVFERRALACPLAFRGHILEHIFLARHIVERTLVRVSFPLFARRIFRQAVRRVLNIEDDGLIAHLRELLNPSASNRSRYSGVSLISPLLKCFASLLYGLRVS